MTNSFSRLVSNSTLTICKYFVQNKSHRNALYIVVNSINLPQTDELIFTPYSVHQPVPVPSQVKIARMHIHIPKVFNVFKAISKNCLFKVKFCLPFTIYYCSCCLILESISLFSKFMFTTTIQFYYRSNVT